MALQGATCDQILSLVAHQPRHIMRGMIQIAEPASTSTAWPASSTSSLGNLEKLPLELLQVALAMLDFQSLSNISRTCLRGIAVVRSVPEYRDLMRHAPKAIAALGKTRLIRYHSAITLHDALLSASCTSCGRFGAFLFLPTCERCCYHCLRRNRSLRVVPKSVARKCFGISPAGMKTLPVMYNIPGKYYVEHMVSRQRSIGLVCVGSAKRLAIEEGRTEDKMRLELDVERHAGLSDKEYYPYRSLQMAPLKPLGHDFFIQRVESYGTNDMFCGMASIPFAHLAPENQPDIGSWCLGCEVVWRGWSRNDPIPAYLSHLLLPGCEPARVVYYIQEVAWSKKDFLSHVSQCPGAQELLRSAGHKGD